MLKLFGGGRAEHPFASPKEARKLIDDLPANDNFRALDELSQWHDSVATAEGFKPEQRVAAHFQIDDAAQSRIRKLSREYLAAERPSRFQENRIWTTVHRYWEQAALAYAKSIDTLAQPGHPKIADAVRSQMPALFARAIRAFAQRLKWMYARYGPIDLATWGSINATYALAEERKIADSRIAIFPGAPETTPRLEYQKALMLGASSPDSLVPRQIEIAERVIAETCSGLLLSNLPGKEFSFWIDLAQPMPPLRLAREPALTPGLRCIGGRPIRDTFATLEQKARMTGAFPQAIGGTDDPDAVMDVIVHFASVWSPEPPERRHPRHTVKSRLTVLSGFEGVLSALGGGGSLDFDSTSGESWIVENVSSGGFGAVVSQFKGDWLKVGALLGLQPEGGNNWIVGLVRRVSKIGGQQARIGIETVSRSPRPCMFGVGEKALSGILLPSLEADKPEVRIALPAGSFSPGMNLELVRDGRSFVYIPIGVGERGDDHEIARFREMLREA